MIIRRAHPCGPDSPWYDTEYKCALIFVNHFQGDFACKRVVAFSPESQSLVSSRSRLRSQRWQAGIRMTKRSYRAPPNWRRAPALLEHRFTDAVSLRRGNVI